MTDGLPLIVTRPEPGNVATVERAKKLGFDARAMPLFAARSLEWAVSAVEDFDALLLTSGFAVKLAGPDLAELSSLPVYAVGAATARAAASAGLTVAMTGSADAQRLLDDMASQNIRTILWLCGRERSEFDARGATITRCHAMRSSRSRPRRNGPTLIAAPAIMLAHSARAAQRISDLVGCARDHLALVAISASVALAAGGDGAISPSRHSPTTRQCWHRRVLCGTRVQNRVVRKRNMAIDSIDTSSPAADEAVPARGLSFRAIALGAFLLLLIGIAGGGWAVNRWLTLAIMLRQRR
jgi:uroporphyrinogen-III synthase